MDSEEKFWLSIVCAFLLTMVIITGMGLLYQYSTITKMAELGYEKTSIVGSNVRTYQKK